MKQCSVGEFLSLLKDEIGLKVIQSEIIKDETVVFRGVYSSGRIICGDYKIGISCHVYVGHKNFDPLNVLAINDLVSAQEKLNHFFDELSSDKIPDDQEHIKEIMGLAYYGFTWGSDE